MLIVDLVVMVLVGLLLGVIGNALADDLPHYRTPRLPHYPDGTPRPPIAWSGLLAFALNRRNRTENPTLKLSWRYPLFELAMVAGLLIAYFRIGSINSVALKINTLQGIFWYFYVAVLLLIIVIDLEHKLILFSVIIPSSLIGLLDAVLTPSNLNGMWWNTISAPTLPNALIGAVVGFGVFALFYGGGFLYLRVVAELRGQQIDDVAFGYGDVMLSTFSGLILGWQPLIFAMFITVFLGAFGSLLYLIAQRITRGHGGLTTALPYGPYIVIGTLAMLLFADFVREFLFGSGLILAFY